MDGRINLNKHVARKARGDAALSKINDAPHYSLKTYDIDTGAVSVEAIPIDRKELVDRRASFAAAIQVLDDFIQEIDDL